MRNTILLVLLMISTFSWAQSDSVDINDILNKLKKLEELKASDDSVNPLKIITDTAPQKVVALETPKKKTSLKINDAIDSVGVITIVDTNVLQPVIHFDTTIYELGSITQGEVAKQKFTFINKGTDNLEISDVAADCSCTSPDWSKGSIKPGEKGYVIATYDSKEDIGKFMKTVTVIHNSGKGYTFLEIRGYVAPKL